MVTGETFSRSAGVVGESRYLGKVRPKGKERAVDIYALRNAGAKSGECWGDEFERAVSAYYRGDFSEAGNAFAALAARYPDDRAVGWYGARCAERASEDATAWDGVEQMTSK